MKMTGAVLWENNKPWTIEEIDLDPPQEGEVVVSWEATGMCHSDHHIYTGDLPAPLPILAGHEGAGTVVEVGAGVRGLEVGDHVIASFLPACGKCRWCATGRSNLCDLGAGIMTGLQFDGTFRRHVGGQDLYAALGLGTFAQYGTVSDASLVKIDDDVPLERACLLGCGIPTGWGSAVHTADVKPGDTVVVMGLGGIGSGAVQGARIAGAERIVVVEPVESKRDKAIQFGATHFCTSMEEATALVAEETRGVMADSALITVGVAKGEMINDALNIVSKGGAVVLTALAPMADVAPVLPMAMFTLFQKRLLGSLYGQSNPRSDIPRLISLYREGKLLLDETVTHEYKLGDINVGYDDMLAGNIIRGVIIHDH